MKPIISVIMPVYNQEIYLAKTIESVLSQTYEDFEFIIIDDGSKDGSRKIISEYATKDNRIVAVYQENLGKPKSLNNASMRAKGRFLAFVDHDDLMLPNRLEKQLLFHNINSNIDASSCHCFYIDKNDNLQGIQRFPFLKNTEECQQALNKKEIICCAFTGFMIKRNVYIDSGGLRSQYWPCDDLDLFNRLIERNYIVVIIQDVLMKYRIHSNATSVRNHWYMYKMICYTNYCIELRRAGNSEISYKSFIDTKQKDAWWIKLKDRIHCYSLVFHRKAGLALNSKKYASFLGSIMIASLLSPNFVYYTFISKIRFSFKHNHFVSL